TATDEIRFEGNLNSNDDKGGKFDTTIQDSLGNSYKITFELKKGNKDKGNQDWDLSVARFTDLATGNYTEDVNGLPKIVGDSKLTFNSNGKLIKIGGKLIEGDDFKDPISIDLTSIGFTHKKDDTTFDVNNKPTPSGKFNED